MPTNAFDRLQERGFIYQSTHEEIRQHFKEPRKFYVGFDPTADSLHVGSLVPIMAMAHCQQLGHTPIALVGGATARVGDPSGKTQMRQMLTEETIEENEQGVAAQLSRYLVLDGVQGILVNNKHWLMSLSYIEFLRDIGVHFSVNRMLTAESVKSRLEHGLSFIEFNYMILQAFDFYQLLVDYQCTVQMGGQDQWGNIVAGMELCRRKQEHRQTFGVTFPLITNSSGSKFGKSEQGNIWLDANRTSVLEFYQFWRNCDDQDVSRFLKLFTFLPLEEIQQLTAVGSNINRAKEILAYEATALTHGKEAAAKAFATAISQFPPADPEGLVETSSDVRWVKPGEEVAAPTYRLALSELNQITWPELFERCGLVQSRSEARRLIEGKGAKYDDQIIDNPRELVQEAHFSQGELTLRKGKKGFMRVVLDS
jgi:tyrosyl-tRNA synthetase